MSSQPSTTRRPAGASRQQTGGDDAARAALPSRRPGGGRVARLAGTLGLATVGIALAAGAVPAGSASAAQRHETLQLSAERAPAGAKAVELSARLTEAGGTGSAATRPVAGATVTFSLAATEFSGAPLLQLGTATTDGHGLATLSYVPSWRGRQELEASVADSSGNTLAEASTSYLAGAATAPLLAGAEAVRPDGTIGQVVVGVLLAIVAVLWIVLASVVVRLHRSSGPRTA